MLNHNIIENSTGHGLYHLIVDTNVSKEPGSVVTITTFQSGMLKGTCCSSTQKAEDLGASLNYTVRSFT